MQLGHVRLKSNGNYWQAFCATGFPVGCKTLSLGAKAMLSRRAAAEQCRELEFQIRSAAQNPQFTSGMPRLSEWLTRCEKQRSRLKEATRRVNRDAGKYLQRYFTADPPIDQISRQDAAEWRAALASGQLSAANKFKSHQKPPHEQTVCKHVRAARKIFNEAKDQDMIDSNPFDRLHATAPEIVRNWAYLDRAAMQLIYDACPNDDWVAFFGLLRFAGLRLSEALKLDWTDVNFEKNRMVVHKATVIDTKSRPRTVPIETVRCPTGLTKILQDALAKAPAGAIKVCERVKAKSVDKQSGRILRRAGIARYAKIHHTLRKNCTMDWAAQFPQHVVADWMGHSAAVSAAHYLRVPEELYAAPEIGATKPVPANS